MNKKVLLSLLVVTGVATNLHAARSLSRLKGKVCALPGKLYRNLLKPYPNIQGKELGKYSGIPRSDEVEKAIGLNKKDGENRQHLKDEDRTASKIKDCLKGKCLQFTCFDVLALCLNKRASLCTQIHVLPIYSDHLSFYISLYLTRE